jgi:hypothetical protein
VGRTEKRREKDKGEIVDFNYSEPFLFPFSSFFPLHAPVE